MPAVVNVTTVRPKSRVLLEKQAKNSRLAFTILINDIVCVPLLILLFICVRSIPLWSYGIKYKLFRFFVNSHTVYKSPLVKEFGMGVT